MKMDVEKLINLIFARKCLWNETNLDYHSQHIQRISWDEIASEMNMPVDDLKKRWSELREMYMMELKKSSANKSDESNSSDWCYFKSLHFLGSEINSAGIITDCAGSNIEISVNDVSNIPETVGNERIVLQEEKEQFLIENGKDMDSQFLASLLPYLKDLPQTEKPIVYDKIKQILIDAGKGSVSLVNSLQQKQHSTHHTANFGGKSKMDEASSSSDKQIFESLSEEEAGITEYLNKSDGFSAIIKERYSDFQVHEIDLEGKLVALTNFDIPVTEASKEDLTDDLLDEKVWKQVESLLENEIPYLEIDATHFDKDKRRKVHKLIKEKYKKLVTTNTVCSGTDDDAKRSIVLSLTKDNRNSWPCGLAPYLHFVLFKSNMDTMEALNLIAGKTKINLSNFAYAGTKDKRGKTSQLVSAWHVTAQKLNPVNKYIKNIKVGNFSYQNKNLRLGDLKGNHFKIALRNVTADRDTIGRALTSLREKGFINYYGLQRFGNSPLVPTFKIGKSLIKGDFKTAVDLILTPRKHKSNNDKLDEARNIWQDTGDAKKACKALFKRSEKIQEGCKNQFTKLNHKSYEGKLLLGLAAHGNKAYVNALNSLPRNVRLLYLHSYQSLLWNKIVSKRIREFGLSVLEGDLIWVTKCEESVENNVESQSSDKVRVRYVTVDEVKSVDIYDVVHPLPGHNVNYPNNIIKNWYQELLKEEGLTSEQFKQSIKQYTLSGAYRNIVTKVKDLSWEIVNYSNPEKDLILSDIDIIEKNLSNLSTEPQGNFKAVILNFSLDSSTYATMAIREVLKINISSSYHASLNSYSFKRKFEGENDTESKRTKA